MRYLAKCIIRQLKCIKTKNILLTNMQTCTFVSTVQTSKRTDLELCSSHIKSLYTVQMNQN